MGNVLSDGGVDKNDINEIKLITLSDSYSPADPIWVACLTSRAIFSM